MTTVGIFYVEFSNVILVCLFLYPSDVASGGNLISDRTPCVRSSGGSTSAQPNNINVD